MSSPEFLPCSERAAGARRPWTSRSSQTFFGGVDAGFLDAGELSATLADPGLIRHFPHTSEALEFWLAEHPDGGSRTATYMSLWQLNWN